MTLTTQPTWDLSEPPPGPVRRFSVEEYHVMIRAGVFGDDDRFELLEGWIVPKMVRKPPHDVTIVLSRKALENALPARWHVRDQSAITTANSEPEPDLAVVRGEARDYLDHHPGPGNIALVVEVADSTIAQDRGLKRRLYARAGIPSYWIINLADRTIEVHFEPSGPSEAPAYRQQQAYQALAAVPLTVDGREVEPIPAENLLP